MIDLNTPVAKLTRVGETVANRLKKLDILTVRELLYHFPFRYEDFSSRAKIADLKPGETATIKGKVELLQTKRSPAKKMLITECFVSDDSGSIKIIWFRQPFISKTIKNGDEIYLSGKIEGDLFAASMTNPVYEKITGETIHTGRLVPIYPLTSGLTQKQLRFLIKQSLPCLPQIKDWLPQKFRQQYNLADLTDALKQVHFPEDQKEASRAQYRLKFEELLKLHLQNEILKLEIQQFKACPIPFNESQTRRLVSGLNFTLTDAQKKAAWQILQDMEKDKPMNRLVQGDVGCGKTVVAALAVANAGLAKKQSALIVPTEILASQHFQEFKNILKNIPLNVALLTRTKQQVYHTNDADFSKITKAKLLKSIAIGEIDLVIGTQALIQDKVSFKNLELVVIDEQHRFGVEQRKALREKSGDSSTAPHLLSMTATPIPRTLALTLYGDLELSIINELPPGRKKPITKLVKPTDRNKAYEFILEKINEGRQAYIICPLVEESDKLGVKAVTEEYQKLSTKIFPQLNIGLLHGKLKPADKEKIMAEFNSGKLDILVATSVVEVGVNVPNASVMIIESAERFGLSQLHQFRGRVNRASHQAYCFLFTETSTAKSLDRLKILASCFDGFKLAQADLKLRGFGDLAGKRQSGFNALFKIADLSDLEMIEQTRQAAKNLIKNYPQTLDNISLKTDFHPE